MIVACIRDLESVAQLSPNILSRDFSSSYQFHYCSHYTSLDICTQAHEIRLNAIEEKLSNLVDLVSKQSDAIDDLLDKYDKAVSFKHCCS